MKRNNNNNLSLKNQRKEREIVKVKAKVKASQMISQVNRNPHKVRRMNLTTMMIIIKEKRKLKENKMKRLPHKHNNRRNLIVKMIY